jgi:hypothetical protein
VGITSFFGKDWSFTQHGRLRFVARHPILTEIAEQLASFDLGDLAQQRADIYVGVHSFTKRVLPFGLKIGLQTEHFYDEKGAALWGLPSRAAILRRALQYDVLLDLSPLNAPAYAFLPKFLRKKLRFGPYIFPDQLPAYRTSPPQAPLIFFGALNPRRQALLAAHPEVRSLASGTHGPALLAEIAASSGIVNLHFSEGIYSEYPRLLTAALAGKVVWSDPLAAPLVAGKHYFSLDQKPTPDQAAEVYAQFCQDFAAKHRFASFLRTALAR